MSGGVPRVSIGLPVYNGANYVGDAIASHLDQTFEDFELIVSDNASDDDTVEIVEELAAKDSRVRLLRNESNVGANRNYNITFAAASRGEYFRWHAHDDLIEPTFLERCVEVLDSDPGVAHAYTLSTLIDGQGHPFEAVGDILLAPDGTIQPHSEDPNFFKYAASDLAHHRLRAVMFHYRQGASFFGLMRRSALSHSKLQQPIYGTDRIMLVELAFAGRFGLVEERLFLHRWHDDASRVLNTWADRSKWSDPRYVPGWYPKTMFLAYLDAIRRADTTRYERMMSEVYLVRKALRHEELARIVSLDAVAHLAGLMRRALAAAGG
jgi:glycosyltransferase involved in cell wall biosynthesis